jgi:mannosyltransferase OCH1-like enzyme
MSIPHQLHFIWVGGPIPQHYADNIHRWQHMHPDWTSRVWGEADFGWLEHQDIFDNAEDYANGVEAHQLRSDIARYEILRKHGGLYVDCDSYPLKPMDDILRRRKEFAAMEDGRWVGNTYLAAVPNHPMFDFLVERLRHSIEHGKRRGWRPAQSSGPQYLTPIWRGHRGFTAPSRLFFPYSFRDVRAGTVPTEFDHDVIAVHQWNNTRSKLGMDF